MLIFAVKIFQDFIIALIKIERFFPDKIYVFEFAKCHIQEWFVKFHESFISKVELIVFIKHINMINMCTIC